MKNTANKKSKNSKKANHTSTSRSVIADAPQNVSRAVSGAVSGISNKVGKRMPKMQTLAAGAVIGIAGYWAARALWKTLISDESISVSPDIRSKLPIAQNLDTVADHIAHYDMDGVSFDEEGVIVSGDQVKPVVAAPI